MHIYAVRTPANNLSFLQCLGIILKIHVLYSLNWFCNLYCYYTISFIMHFHTANNYCMIILDTICYKKIKKKLIGLLKYCWSNKSSTGNNNNNVICYTHRHIVKLYLCRIYFSFHVFSFCLWMEFEREKYNKLTKHDSLGQ